MAEAGTKDEGLVPGPQLLKAVRAGFVMRGTTLNAWCKKHQIHRSNATGALLGAWRGPKGKAIVAKVTRASGVGTVRWDQ